MNHRIVTIAAAAILSSALSPTYAADPAESARPKVLIIGDSISLGYTPHVVEMLKSEADVVHNRGNAQHSGTGVKKIDDWLGDTKWDVIHFNWGLWDLCYRNPESKVQGRRDKVNGTLTLTLEEYEKNLDQLVARMAKTGAKLIWASTTVVPDGEAGRKVGDDLKYNGVASRVMEEYGVPTNDLNKLSRTFLPELFTAPGNVHFKAEGSQRLAAQVADSIRVALRLDNAARPISRILFGSCIKQEKPAPIFDAINARDADLFVFLGDNIYGDTEDMQVLSDKYAKLAAIPGFAQLRESTDVLATWDDHDYGVNDGGADYPKRDESERVFLDFWKEPAHSVRRRRPGVYDTHVFGPEGRRVQVILLDTRYFRSPLKRGAERRTGGPYTPDDSAEKTVLGEAQWKWLAKQLRVPAELRLIATSIQCIAEDDGQETWSNLPLERSRFFRLLTETKANGVVLISGDRHWSELSSVEDGLPYRLYDLTSSSLNQPHGRGTPTLNRFRHLPQTYHKENFGEISIDWNNDVPQISMQIRDMQGKTQIEHEVPLSALK